MIKIFHTADIHLDSPFGALSPQRSEERRAELRDIFSRMMSYAAEQADIILLPGDVFDSAFAGRDTVERLCRDFAEAKIPVVIAPGNHDPYTADGVYATEKFPENVYIFSSEQPSYFDFPELRLRVWGAAFTSDRMNFSPLMRIPALSEDTVNLLCLHGDTRLTPGKCPLNVRDVIYRKFNYAALGHIHLAPEAVVDGKTTVAYSGCPVGRSFDEPGYGSAILATVDDGGNTEIERIRFCDKRYMVNNVDITSLSSDLSASEKVKDLIREQGYGEETALRVILTGDVPPSYRPSCELIRRTSRGELSLLEIKDRTVPCFDISYLESDMTLRGAFYRMLAPRLHEGSERERHIAAEALRAGLAAIDNRDIFPEEVSK